jgi:hypothetical protein
MQPSELVDIFGSQTAVNDVIAGNTIIDRTRAKLLGQLFHVDTNLFL